MIYEIPYLLAGLGEKALLLDWCASLVKAFDRIVAEIRKNLLKLCALGKIVGGATHYKPPVPTSSGFDLQLLLIIVILFFLANICQAFLIKQENYL